MFTETATQATGVVDVLNNVTTSNNTVTSAAYVDMQKYKRAFYILAVETVAGGVVSAKLQSASATNFGTAHDLSGTNTGNFNTNNQVITLEVRADQVTAANSSDRYVRLSVTSNNNVTVWGVGLGLEAAQKPGNAGNLNSTYIAAQTVCNT